MRLEQVVAPLLEQVPRRIDEQLVSEVLLSPWFYGSLILVLALEWLVPAKPTQRSIGAGVRQDLLWVVFGIPIGVVAIATCLLVSRELYRAHLSFLTIRHVCITPTFAAISASSDTCW